MLLWDNATMQHCPDSQDSPQKTKRILGHESDDDSLLRVASTSTISLALGTQIPLAVALRFIVLVMVV